MELSESMEKIVACVFPGQGSQRPGMGKDFYDNIPVSKQTYDEASDALGWDVSAMCFGEDERLNLTEYTQPCILTMEIAALRGLACLYGFSPTIYGGHSLGEFTALLAAGVLTLAEAVKIVHIRGRLMQKAVPLGEGGMAAVISQNIDMTLLRKHLTDIPVDVANVNSAHQVVISGRLSALPEAEKRLRAAFAHDPGFRFVTLNVSAPFHSRFMQTIEEPFAQTLREVGKHMTTMTGTKVTSNFTGGFHSDNREAIICCLVSQLSNTVRWIDNMKCIAAQTDIVYEIGPGRPLRDFFKTVGITCSSITNLPSAERIFRDVN
jgi:[acyl-carrier-protein] S-malonyltransferase